MLLHLKDWLAAATTFSAERKSVTHETCHLIKANLTLSPVYLEELANNTSWSHDYVVPLFSSLWSQIPESFHCNSTLQCFNFPVHHHHASSFIAHFFFLLPLTPTPPPHHNPSPSDMHVNMFLLSMYSLLHSCLFISRLVKTVCCSISQLLSFLLFKIFILFLNSLLVLLFFYTSSSKPTCTRSIEKNKNKKVGRQSGRVGQLLLVLWAGSWACLLHYHAQAERPSQSLYVLISTVCPIGDCSDAHIFSCWALIAANPIDPLMAIYSQCGLWLKHSNHSETKWFHNGVFVNGQKGQEYKKQCNHLLSVNKLRTCERAVAPLFVLEGLRHSTEEGLEERWDWKTGAVPDWTQRDSSTNIRAGGNSFYRKHKPA